MAPIEWEYDTTSREGKNKYLPLLDLEFESTIEKRITKHIQENLSFIIISVANKNDRLRLESGLISSISNCAECPPSPHWLGTKSPKDKIRQSGLWQVNELYGKPLSDDDFDFIENALIQS